MARYQTKTIRIGYWGDRKVRRLVARGWEVVHSSGGALGTGRTITLRREKASKR